MARFTCVVCTACPGWTYTTGAPAYPPLTPYSLTSSFLTSQLVRALLSGPSLAAPGVPVPDGPWREAGVWLNGHLPGGARHGPPNHGIAAV